MHRTSLRSPLKRTTFGGLRAPATSVARHISGRRQALLLSTLLQACITHSSARLGSSSHSLLRPASRDRKRRREKEAPRRCLEAEPRIQGRDLTKRRQALGRCLEAEPCIQGRDLRQGLGLIARWILEPKPPQAEPLTEATAKLRILTRPRARLKNLRRWLGVHQQKMDQSLSANAGTPMWRQIFQKLAA